MATLAVAPRSIAAPAVSGWRVVKAPKIPDGELLAVAGEASDDVWAVGDSSANADFLTLALHWDGTSWTQVHTPSIGDWNMLRGIAVISKTDAWAVGFTHDYTTLLEHWDGATWSIVDSPVVKAGAPLYGVTALATDDVWAAGGNGEHSYLVHWDGSAWRAVRHPEPPGSSYAALTNITSTSADDIWAVGSDVARTEDPLVLHYDGSAWAVQSTPRHGEYLYLSGVGASSSTDAWFAGWFSDSAERPLVEHGNGAAWSFVPSSPDMIPIRVVSVSTSDAWISGYEGFYQAAMEHWDGTSWTKSTLPDIGDGDSELYGLGLVPGGGMWAVGDVEPNGVTQPLIEYNPAP
jgi:hypothetical protein